MNGVSPSVAVVVTCSGLPEQLTATIDAVRGQDYEGLLSIIVVVEDGLKDGAERSLSQSTADQAVTVTVNDRTPGTLGARNVGILWSQAELVAFCECGDIWAPAKVRRQIEVLVANEDVGFVGSGVLLDNEDESVKLVRHTSRVTFRDLLRAPVHEAHASTLMMRREELIERIGLLDEEAPAAFFGEYEWLLRATRLTDLLLVPAVLVTAQSTDSETSGGDQQTRLDGLRYLLDTYPEFETDPTGHSRLLRQMAVATAALGDRRGAWELTKKSFSLPPAEGPGGRIGAFASDIPASLGSLPFARRKARVS